MILLYTGSKLTKKLTSIEMGKNMGSKVNIGQCSQGIYIFFHSKETI